MARRRGQNGTISIGGTTIPVRVHDTGAGNLVGGTISIGGTKVPIRSGTAVGRREEVFYAPLDGSRIDYHPCGRPEDHPTYLDPDSPIGDERVAPEELHQMRREVAYYTAMHLCGRCGWTFAGLDAGGQYITHRCPCGPGPEILDRVERLMERFRSQTPEAVEEYIARRVRDGRDS